MPRPFQGEIELDVRDSRADWDAFRPDQAPAGAQNDLVVPYDDTSLCGEGPCIGYDIGDKVSSAYPHRFEFTGGEIVRVVVDWASTTPTSTSRYMAAARARD
jgi:hypothetical protein